jgi:hypothetical protein
MQHHHVIDGELPPPQPDDGTGTVLLWPADMPRVQWNKACSTLAMFALAAFALSGFVLVAVNFHHVGKIMESGSTVADTAAAKVHKLVNMVDDIENLMTAFRSVNMTEFMQNIDESARASGDLMQALEHERSIRINLPFFKRPSDDDDDDEGETSGPEPTQPPSRGGRPKPRGPSHRV